MQRNKKVDDQKVTQVVKALPLSQRGKLEKTLMLFSKSGSCRLLAQLDSKSLSECEKFLLSDALIMIFFTQTNRNYPNLDPSFCYSTLRDSIENLVHPQFETRKEQYLGFVDQFCQNLASGFKKEMGNLALPTCPFQISYPLNYAPDLKHFLFNRYMQISKTFRQNRQSHSHLLLLKAITCIFMFAAKETYTAKQPSLLSRKNNTAPLYSADFINFLIPICAELCSHHWYLNDMAAYLSCFKDIFCIENIKFAQHQPIDIWENQNLYTFIKNLPAMKLRQENRYLMLHLHFHIYDPSPEVICCDCSEHSLFYQTSKYRNQLQDLIQYCQDSNQDPNIKYEILLLLSASYSNILSCTTVDHRPVFEQQYSTILSIIYAIESSHYKYDKLMSIVIFDESDTRSSLNSQISDTKDVIFSIFSNLMTSYFFLLKFSDDHPTVCYNLNQRIQATSQSHLHRFPLSSFGHLLLSLTASKMRGNHLLAIDALIHTWISASIVPKPAMSTEEIYAFEHAILQILSAIENYPANHTHLFFERLIQSLNHIVNTPPLIPNSPSFDLLLSTKIIKISDNLTHLTRHCHLTQLYGSEDSCQQSGNLYPFSLPIFFRNELTSRPSICVSVPALIELLINTFLEKVQSDFIPDQHLLDNTSFLIKILDRLSHEKMAFQLAERLYNYLYPKSLSDCFSEYIEDSMSDRSSQVDKFPSTPCCDPVIFRWLKATMTKIPEDEKSFFLAIKLIAPISSNLARSYASSSPYQLTSLPSSQPHIDPQKVLYYLTILSNFSISAELFLDLARQSLHLIKVFHKPADGALCENPVIFSDVMDNLFNYRQCFFLILSLYDFPDTQLIHEEVCRLKQNLSEFVVSLITVSLGMVASTSQDSGNSYSWTEYFSEMHEQDHDLDMLILITQGYQNHIDYSKDFCKNLYSVAHDFCQKVLDKMSSLKVFSKQHEQLINLNQSLIISIQKPFTSGDKKEPLTSPESTFESHGFFAENAKKSLSNETPVSNTGIFAQSDHTEALGLRQRRRPGV